MRKLYISLTYGLCCLFFAFHLKAQPTFSISPQNITASVGETVTVDITVADFTDIVSFQYSINWDESVLSFVSVDDINGNLSGFNGNSFGTPDTDGFPENTITVSWLDPNIEGVMLADGSVLFSITLMAIANGDSQILFTNSPVPIEVIDATLNPVDVTVEGAETVVGEGGGGTGMDVDVNFDTDDQSVDAGQQVCVPISVSGFNDITGFQFSISYNSEDLEFSGIQNLNLTSLDMDAFGLPGQGDVPVGFVTVGWVDGQGVTVDDETAIFEVCFNAIGDPGSSSQVVFSNFPVPIEITDFDENNVMLIAQDATVSINEDNTNMPGELTMNIDDGSGTQGDQVCLDVIAESGFENITDLQFSIDYDPAILEFVSVGNFNLNGLNTDDFDLPPGDNNPGDITLSWTDNAMTGVDLPDGTVVFEVCFDAVGGTATDVTFSDTPTAIDVTDADDEAVNFTGEDGTVSLTPDNSGGGDFLLTIEDFTADPGDMICLDVTTTNFTDIIGLQFSLDYDPSELEFTSVGNFNLDGLNANTFGLPNDGGTPGDITLSWLDNSLEGVTLADGTVLFEVCFEVIGDNTSDVTFSNSPTGIEVTDVDENSVDFNGEDGTVTVEGGGGGNPGDFLLTIDDITAEQGDMICLDVTTTNFTDIIGLQFSLNYDPSELEFTSVGNFNLDGLSASLFGLPNDGGTPGNITLSWLDNSLEGVTLADGTVLFEVCFEVVGDNTSDVTFSNSPTGIEVTDVDENSVDFNGEDGTVTVEGGGGGNPGDFLLTIEDIEAEQGDMICLDVTADNFTDIIGLQFSMNYDPSELEFTSVGNFNLDGLSESLFGLPNDGGTPGNITLSWLDNSLEGVTVADGTVLFEVCFEVLGDNTTTDVTFSSSPTGIEVTDVDENSVDFNGEDGTVTIGEGNGGGGPDGFTLEIEDVVAEQGDMICLDVTAYNFTNILGLQFSIDYDPALLEFQSVQNLNLEGLTEAMFGLPTDGGTPGSITLSWLDPDVEGITVADETVLFQLCFEVLGDLTTVVDFSNSPTGIEVTDGDENPVDFNSESGTITIMDIIGPDDFALFIEDVTAETGETVCLGVTTQNFDNILGMQFSMNYDPSLLEFQSVGNFNLNGLAAAQFGLPNDGGTPGNITLSWLDPDVEGVTLPDDTEIFEICFEVIGDEDATVTFSNSPTSIEITDGDENPVDFNGDPGVVTIGVEQPIDPLELSISTESVNAGEQACVDVVAESGFENITDFQFSIDYDENALTYASVVLGPALTGLDMSDLGVPPDTDAGTITVDWEDGAPDGVTLTDGTILFQLCFDAEGDPGSNIPVTFSDMPTDTSANNAIPVAIPLDLSDGAVIINNIDLEGFHLVMSDVDLCTEEDGFNFCVQVTTNDFTNILGMQFSIQYDASIMQLDSITNFNLDGLVESSFGTNIPGTITASWLDADLEGVGVPNGPPIFEMCFTALVDEAPVSIINFSDSPTTIEITDGDEQSVEFNGIGSVVNISCEPNNNLPLEVELVEIIDVDCFGEATGSIEISASGGLPPYDIEWSIPGTGGTIENLSAGDYSVTVTSGDGQTFMETYTVDEPASAVTIDDVQIVSEPGCNGDATGAIDVSASGGTGQLSYSWNPPQLGDTPNPTGLEARFYRVTVTDENGCEAISPLVEITEPDPLQINIGSIQNVLCSGECTGMININVTGGTEPYTIDWSDDLTDDVTTQSDLCAGAYSVTVTDANGCTVSSNNINILDLNDPLEITSMTPTYIQDGNDGSITVQTAGGAGTLSYSWSGPQSPLADAVTISNLSEVGEYCVTITDGNGCTTSGCTDLILALSISEFSITKACPGSESGAIDITVLGGRPGYTFEWTVAGDDEVISEMEDLTGVAAGTYSVVVTDDEGNQVSGNFDVTSYPAMDVSATVTEATNGNDGTIDLDISGGEPGYSVSWDNGDTGEFIDGLTPGEYCATIADGNNCFFDTCFVVPAAPLAISLTPTDVVCNGDENGTITVDIQGGIPDYTIEVDGMQVYVGDESQVLLDGLGAGDHTVVVTDSQGDMVTEMASLSEPDPITFTSSVVHDTGAPGCMGSISLFIEGGTGPYTVNWNGNFSGPQIVVCGGSYVPTIIDANNCVITGDAINVSTFDVAYEEVVDVQCAGQANGAIIISVTGGDMPYTYEWLNMSGEVIGTTQNLMDVPAGAYRVRVTEASGNTIVTEPQMIGTSSNLSIQTAIESSYNGYHVSCSDASDGEISVTATDGEGDIFYEWTMDGQVMGSDAVLSDVPAGTYQVMVSDEAGCSIDELVTIEGPNALAINGNAKDVSCPGQKDGEVVALASGGAAGFGYTYEWSSGDITNQATGLLPGDYTVTATDANGCEMSSTFTVGEPEPMIVTIETEAATDRSCNGMIRVVVEGGTEPYTYDWVNLEADPTSSIVTDLCPDPNYQLYVTDANGCNSELVIAKVADKRYPCFEERVVITPEGDGLNDEFMIFCIDELPDNHLEIYNRWGQLVFETDNYDNTWEGTTQDGARLPEGPYYYVLDYLDVATGEMTQVRGSLTILRE